MLEVPRTFSNSYSTANKMHLFLKLFYSCKMLYMFWTVFPCIIRSSKLHMHMSNICC